jgi:CBS-domain-containing membrane protein
MTAATIMNAHPVALQAGDTVAHAIGVMLEHRLSNVPVVDAGKHFLGQFSMRGLMRLLLPRAATLDEGLVDLSFVADAPEHLRQRLQQIGGEKIADHLDDAPACVEPDAHLTETLLHLYRHGESLAVVDKTSGALAGVISPWDVVAGLSQRGQA